MCAPASLMEGRGVALPLGRKGIVFSLKSEATMMKYEWLSVL